MCWGRKRSSLPWRDSSTKSWAELPQYKNSMKARQIKITHKQLWHPLGWRFSLALMDHMTIASQIRSLILIQAAHKICWLNIAQATCYWILRQAQIWHRSLTLGDNPITTTTTIHKCTNSSKSALNLTQPTHRYTVAKACQIKTQMVCYLLDNPCKVPYKTIPRLILTERE